MREYVGALHLHSAYSDGSGTLREMTAAAARAGLDYFVLTDHDTLRPCRDGWQGWNDGVLVIAGVEVSCKRHCHIVALGARDVADLRHKPMRRVLFELGRQGARAFVAHAHPAQIMGWPLKGGALHEWEVPGFTGVELWSFMHDVCDGLTPWRIPSFVYNWRRRVRGPHPETVAHYDRITQARRFAAVGSLDNHAIAVPVIGRRIIPYEDGFRTLRTHVLAPELAGTPADAAAIVHALAEGRAFLALDLWADARGFAFEGRRGGDRIRLGEAQPWDGPVDLAIRSPVAARLRLVRNGEMYAEADGLAMTVTVDAPGVYRVEAHLEGRPWVFTNPVYLRAREGPDER